MVTEPVVSWKEMLMQPTSFLPTILSAYMYYATGWSTWYLVHTIISILIGGTFSAYLVVLAGRSKEWGKKPIEVLRIAVKSKLPPLNKLLLFLGELWVIWVLVQSIAMFWIEPEPTLGVLVGAASWAVVHHWAKGIFVSLWAFVKKPTGKKSSN